MNPCPLGNRHHKQHNPYQELGAVGAVELDGGAGSDGALCVGVGKKGVGKGRERRGGGGAPGAAFHPELARMRDRSAARRGPHFAASVSVHRVERGAGGVAARERRGGAIPGPFTEVEGVPFGARAPLPPAPAAPYRSRERGLGLAPRPHRGAEGGGDGGLRATAVAVSNRAKALARHTLAPAAPPAALPAFERTLGATARVARVARAEAIGSGVGGGGGGRAKRNWVVLRGGVYQKKIKNDGPPPPRAPRLKVHTRQSRGFVFTMHTVLEE